MAFKLDKPCDENKLADFIVKYNHTQGLSIEETLTAYYALAENEIMQDGKPVVDLDYEKKKVEARENQFKNEFFQTTLGWIRRKVNMKDGSVKDFLSDLLLQIKAGIELGQKVEIITYKQPDFSRSADESYMQTLQEKKIATPEFIKECLARTVADFSGE